MFYRIDVIENFAKFTIWPGASNIIIKNSPLATASAYVEFSSKSSTE